jgi:hypothetical protein
MKASVTFSISATHAARLSDGRSRARIVIELGYQG